MVSAIPCVTACITAAWSELSVCACTIAHEHEGKHQNNTKTTKQHKTNKKPKNHNTRQTANKYLCVLTDQKRLVLLKVFEPNVSQLLLERCHLMSLDERVGMVRVATPTCTRCRHLLRVCGLLWLVALVRWPRARMRGTGSSLFLARYALVFEWKRLNSANE